MRIDSEDLLKMVLAPNKMLVYPVAMNKMIEKGDMDSVYQVYVNNRYNKEFHTPVHCKVVNVCDVLHGDNVHPWVEKGGRIKIQPGDEVLMKYTNLADKFDPDGDGSEIFEVNGKLLVQVEYQNAYCIVRDGVIKTCNGNNLMSPMVFEALGVKEESVNRFVVEYIADPVTYFHKDVFTDDGVQLYVGDEVWCDDAWNLPIEYKLHAKFPRLFAVQRQGIMAVRR